MSQSSTKKEIIMKIIEKNMAEIIIILIFVIVFSSCGTSKNLTNEQVKHRNNIDYELEKVYLEYSYKRDSLIIEFYKK